MKKQRNLSVVKLLEGLDSVQLKELRGDFNSTYRENMHRLDQEERKLLLDFVDSLRLDKSWIEYDRDAVSLIRWELSAPQRSKLDDLSNTISRAFRSLTELKQEVAQDCRRSGSNFSTVFYTTIKRMKRYEEKYR